MHFALLLCSALCMMTIRVVRGDADMALYLPMTNSADDATDESYTFVLNAQHGIYTDAFGVSKPGYAFSTTPGYIMVSQSTALDVGQSSFTIAMWVKFHAVVTTKQRLFSHRAPSSGYVCSSTSGYELSVVNGQLLFFIGKGLNGQCSYSDRVFYTPSLIEPNKWYFVGVSFSRSGPSSLYFNGVKVTTFTFTNTYDYANGQAVYLGNNYDRTEPMNGTIGSTVFYSRALTQSEMVALYTNITMAPTMAPSAAPTTSSPSLRPTTLTPTHAPSRTPTSSPTASPSTGQPSTLTPSKLPTTAPSAAPTHNPTPLPTPAPSQLPTLPPTPSPSTNQPSTLTPSEKPTAWPSTTAPTVEESMIALITPSPSPTRPSFRPTETPTTNVQEEEGVGQDEYEDQPSNMSKLPLPVLIGVVVAVVVVAFLCGLCCCGLCSDSGSGGGLGSIGSNSSVRTDSSFFSTWV